MDNYHETFIPLPDIYSAGGAIFDYFVRKGHENEKNLIIISPGIIGELERRRDRETDGNAGKALAWLKAQRLSKEGSEVPIAHTDGGLDIVMMESDDQPQHYDGLNRMYHEVVTLCKKVAAQKLEPQVVTNLDALHIRLNACGIKVEDSKFLQVDANIVMRGNLTGTPELWSEMQRAGDIGLPAEAVTRALNQPELYQNQFIRFQMPSGDKYARVSGTLRHNSDRTRVVSVEDLMVHPLPDSDYDLQIRHTERYVRDNVLGIKPLDMEQFLAFQYLLFNPEVELIFLCGGQGTGKSLLSYVASIDQVLRHHDTVADLRENRRYSHMVLIKPNDVIGGAHRDIGYLPGNVVEKIKPHIGAFVEAHNESILGRLFPFDDMFKHPVFDNDFGAKRSQKGTASVPDPVMTQKNMGAKLPDKCEAIEIAHSGFLRGRSIKDVVCVVSEAQNFKPYEVKCIIERMGPGSKMIIEGDPWQVDNPECSIAVNGLTSAIKHFFGKTYVGMLCLFHNHRHQMSDDAREWNAFSTTRVR